MVVVVCVVPSSVSGSVCHSLAGVTNLLSDYPIWIHTGWLSIPSHPPRPPAKILLMCCVFVWEGKEEREREQVMFLTCFTAFQLQVN